jgi:hypothetical protein
MPLELYGRIINALRWGSASKRVDRFDGYYLDYTG